MEFCAWNHTEIQYRGELMEDILKEYVEHPENIYGDGFFKSCGKSRAWQNEIGPRMAFYQFKSVLDMGCACGYYLEGFKKSGVNDLTGIEYVYDMAKKYIPESIEGDVMFGDLNKEIDLGRVFDLVISVEVAEHLLPTSCEIYAKNLCRHVGRYLLFSASNDGSSGTAHINPRPMDFWQELMRANGLVVSTIQTDIVRKIYREIPIGNPYKRYMSKVVFVFERNK